MAGDGPGGVEAEPGSPGVAQTQTQTQVQVQAQMLIIPSSAVTVAPSSPPPTVAKRVATPLSLPVYDSVPGSSQHSPMPARGTGNPAGVGSASHGDSCLAATSPTTNPDFWPHLVAADAAHAEPRAIRHQWQEEQQQQQQQQSSCLVDPHYSQPPPRILPDGTLAAATDGVPANKMAKRTPPPVLEPLICGARPLRTASVQAGTTFAHPKPLAHSPVIIRSSPDRSMRSGSAASNIAQLEATAERLSMTSSIDHAIRDLHSELKRNDSRRSAHFIVTSPTSPDANTTSHPGHMSRHMSTASSIVSTNTAARHGGYSPAGFVISPNTSMTSRLRSWSGSVHSTVRPDVALDVMLSRHGPVKSSIGSVRSNRKLSLAEISESEPVSLNKRAFDAADAAPPLEEQNGPSMELSANSSPIVSDDGIPPSTGSRHQPPRITYSEFPIESQRNPTGPSPPQPSQVDVTSFEQRPESAHSNNTSEQAREAFIDFDGVHWEPRDKQREDLEEEDLISPTRAETVVPTPRPTAISMARPQSFIDLSSGQQMLYYPARVPAMLNVPPKLSTKPKTIAREQRRSQILSVMLDRRVSDMGPTTTDLETPQKPAAWLPDPVASHRNSFAALSSSFGLLDDAEPQPGMDQQAPVPETLRRPERLSRGLKEHRESARPVSGKLPPQLRASAFFDLPSVTPEIKVKEGSAMATLDSLLDASASAPVCAFTDNAFTSGLEPDGHGKHKTDRSRQSLATLQPAAADSPRPQKRFSMMWLGKRSSSHEIEEQKRPHSSLGVTSNGAYEDTALLTPGGADSTDHAAPDGNDDDADDQENGEEEDVLPDENYQGPPTTLLAELQLRKQEQKLRVRNLGKGLPNGNYATLLEMDTVAEAQRKTRQTKRVNLAWEEDDAHRDQNGSDDEEVPLAIVAAIQRGAKNQADLDRPLGLMERREMEDNEPLSHRRARLQGLEVPAPSPFLSHRQSMLSFATARALEVPSLSPGLPSPSAGSQSAEVEELEEETMDSRRRRLTSQEGELPKARSVSGAFSAELLGQFGDLGEPQGASESQSEEKKETRASDPSGEDETLGQRRRRLQAEREARDREMGLGGGTREQPNSPDQRRLSLANVLAAHPSRDADLRTHPERLRRMSERRDLRDHDNKMAALRMQMPTSLPQINVQRSGGFRHGAFNDGAGGGYGLNTTLSSPSVNTFGLATGDRSSMIMGYGMPGYGVPVAHTAYGGMGAGYGTPVAQTAYGGMGGVGSQTLMGVYNAAAPTSLYNNQSASQMCVGSGVGGGVGGMLPMPLNSPRSMDRVEQWRYGVRP